MGDRVEAFVEDILAAPDELAAVLGVQARAIAALPADVITRVRWRLVGMGSSRFASLDAATRLRAAGLDAVAETASASEPSPPGADTLAVTISASGRTPEVLEAADRHRAGSSFVVGLTAVPDSPLAGRVDAVVPLTGERSEAAGIASLTYRATVAGLALLADAEAGRLPGAGLAVAVPALEALIRDRSGWLGDAADALDGGRAIAVLADGARLGMAEQAALMLREAPRIPAQAVDTGDWLHVGLYTLFPGDLVLLFAGSSADDDVVGTVRARGGVVVSVGPKRGDTDVHVPLPAAALEDAGVRSLVESAVAELIAAELWRRTDAAAIGEAPGG